MSLFLLFVFLVGLTSVGLVVAGQAWKGLRSGRLDVGKKDPLTGSQARLMCWIGLLAGLVLAAICLAGILRLTWGLW